MTTRFPLLRPRRPWLAAAFLAVCALRAPADALNSTAVLAGTVSRAGQPAARVTVVASGNDRTDTVQTNAQGRFAFRPLPLGSYDLLAESGELSAHARVDLGSGGASVDLVLTELKKIGGVTVSREQAAPILGSGSDVVLNSTALTQLPFDNNFANMEIQMPGAVRGADGVVHINGDHGVIDYQIDGVPLPQELNRDIGGEIDLNDLSFVDLIEGAYPAQYGLRFGSVFNMSTRAGTGPAGFDGFASYGSYSSAESTVGYHAPLANGGGYDIALSGDQTTRGLDPPNFSSPHNDAAGANQFARFTVPSGSRDFTNITIIHSAASFQIPNDVNNGEPASTDDNETQDDLLLTAQFHHAIGDTGVLTFGPAYKAGRIQDFGDPQNDFAYGEFLNAEPFPYGNGGDSADCATALTDKSATFLPTTCAYSLADTRTALDYIMQADYSQRFGEHTVAAGTSYDLSRILKYYALALQPDNFLAPELTPKTPGAATTVVDNTPNTGNTYQEYLQDSWRLSPLWEADYGMRYDFFSIKSSEFAQGFGGFSPRVKLTRFFGRRASLYAYLGRFFEPFSLENVSPSAAYLLNLPLERTEAEFDLKPERDTQLELGGHLPLGPGELGFRVWQKNANNLIDDTQVGVTLLHQDINYVLGRLSQEALSYTQPLPRNGRAYVSLAHVVSLNSGCDTQLLAPCFGQPTGFTPADHEQNWTMAGGALLNNRHGGWFSADGEYGSGLSSSENPTGGVTCAGTDLVAPSGGPCKRTPHTTFNVEEGVALSPKAVLTLGMQNILNDRYFVTYLNAQGNHVAPPRTFQMGVRFKP